MRFDHGLNLEGEPMAVDKPSGAVIVNGQQVADTLQCCHCNRTWIPVHGSGKVRGFCPVCKRVTCGTPACNAYHAPKGAILDFMDGGGRSTPEQIRMMKKLERDYPGIAELAKNF